MYRSLQGLPVNDGKLSNSKSVLHYCDFKAEFMVQKGTISIIIDRNEKDGDMYISSEFTAGIKT